jgi:CheY-like chemotaxis protein
VQDQQASADLRALVVDDNPGQRRLLGQVLRSLGAVIDFAEDGSEALIATAERRYDLILMDINMPRLDGLAATRLIRAREREGAARPTPLYLVTSLDDDEHRLAASEAGADGHIPKPTSIGLLFEAVRHGMEAQLAA